MLIRALSAISVAAMLVVSAVVYKAPVAHICTFIIFILMYVQLPGLMLVRTARIKPRHISALLVIGLFTGWALEMLLYFITDKLGNNILLYSVGPVLSIIYILYYGISARGEKPVGAHALKEPSLLTEDSGFILNRIDLRKVPASWCLFFALSFLFILLKTQYVYMSPEYCDFIYMNADKAYHMGLINSLAYDYPLQSPWIQGRFINYHIFTEILYAIPVRLFGISSDTVLSSCGPLMTAYTLCLTFYAFFRTFCRRADRAGIYCLIMLLSNIFIVRNPSSSIAFLFAYKNENTAGYGIAGAMAVILMFKEWYEGSSLKNASEDSPEGSSAPGRRNALSNLPAFIVLLALVMCETGIKGPMGAVIIAGIWGTFILGLIMRKVKFSKVISFLILSAGFITIYVTVLGSKGQSNSSGNALFALATISDICFWKAPLREWMQGMGVPYVVMLGVILLVFMMFMLTVYFLPFVIGYIRELFLVLTGKKDFDFTRIVIYAASLVGLVAMFILNYSGHSQIYFGLVTVFFAPLISYWLIEDLEAEHVQNASASSGRRKGSFTLYALRGICCLLLIATTVSLCTSYGANIREAVKHSDPARTYNKYKSISNDEYEAMVWLRDNTPTDSLLATDRYYSVPLDKYSYDNRWDNRFFLYAVYSQRFCYIAGSGYNLGANEWPIRQKMIETNSQLYDPDNEDRGELAQELGVDYVVVSKRFTDIPSLEGDDYDLCFSNDDVDIYQVKDAA